MQRVGDLAGAAFSWDQAVRLAPMNYTLLVQAGDFHAQYGDWRQGEAYLRQAVGLSPDYVNAYQILAGHLLRRELGREGHRVALEGLALAGPDQELWALVSESYLLKGDLPAAARARRAAIGLGPDRARHEARLQEILEAMNDSAEGTGS
jgi:tetratricopeptide (TPR) repeat protein